MVGVAAGNVGHVGDHAVRIRRIVLVDVPAQHRHVRLPIPLRKGRLTADKSSVQRHPVDQCEGRCAVVVRHPPAFVRVVHPCSHPDLVGAGCSRQGVLQLGVGAIPVHPRLRPGCGGVDIDDGPRSFGRRS